MTIVDPLPLPSDGKRSLSPREAAQRARALACVRDANRFQCQGQVFVSLFFDGTNNNKDWAEPGQTQTQQARNGHSNIARLFDAHPADPSKGIFRYYIPGVGTPFQEIGDAGGGRGAGMGHMGADRINWGITRIYDAAHRFLVDAPLIPQALERTIVNNLSSAVGNLGFEGSMRRMALTTWEGKLEQVVKNHQRKVTQINVAIFGFSRGAATARACANWIYQICESEDGGYRVASVPIRVYFLGLFDTVASVGVADAIPGFDGHMAWADGNMDIHPGVEECVHFVALHEQRASFPLEEAVGRRNVVYPGMHSDIGGGYTPGEQGKSMAGWAHSPQLSQPPLIDMHHAALAAGVPLLTREQIAGRTALARAFTMPPELVPVYNGYLAQHGVARARGLDATVRDHVRLYLRYRGLRLKADGALESQPFFMRAPSADQADLRAANDDLRRHMAELQARAEANATPEGRRREKMRDAMRAVSPTARLAVPDGKEPLSEVEAEALRLVSEPGSLPIEICRLFDDYMHDSRAGFKVPGLGIEPRGLTGGYVRYRRVFLRS